MNKRGLDERLVAEGSMGSKDPSDKPEVPGYLQRVKHYFKITNPLHLLATEQSLQRARDIVKTPTKKKKNQNKELSEAEIRAAESLYDSAYHPVTGERRPWITRVAAQTPLRALTLGAMLSFQETVPQIIFCQWFHQTVMSLVDYYNRGPVPASEIGCAYSASTIGATATALALNKKLRCSSPLMRRLIPLIAVTVGSVINVPMIKNREILDGVMVETKAKQPVGMSKSAGLQSALNSAFSRILQLAPALILAPYVLTELEKKNKFCKQPMLEVLYAIGLTGLVLFLTTPFVLASFGERVAVKTETLEEEIRKAKNAKEPFLYYNREIL